MAITQRGSVLPSPSPQISAQYGSAVAISADGTVLAVGANQHNATYSDCGAVFIYDLVGGAWVQRGIALVAGDAQADDYFGSALALSDDGSVLAVGATGHDILGVSRGGVYIYDWTTVWTQRGSVLEAADHALNDNFGASLALSANGSVLAVGARAWEGAASNQGGVYIYDWTTVWTQRGSVVVASDAAADDFFGHGVALSDDGAILAVGAATWEGSVSGQGAVYLYDWSGTAWIERAGIVTASDAATGKTNFGTSVALNAAGTVLAVGAIAWDGVYVNQGAVYIYDWLISSWSQREILMAADAADSDFFGSSVALSDNAAVMVIGAINWEGSEFNQGGVYTYDVVVDALTTATAPTSLTMLLSSAVAISYTELKMEARAYAPTSLTMLAPSGQAQAPTELTMSAFGVVLAPTVLAVIDRTDAARWSAVCLIDGVDASSRLVGQARVTCDEGAARIASLTLQPASGAIDPLDYVGRPITLDYVLVVGGTPVPRRLFTGRIDTPEYDTATTLLTLTCVDDLQNRVAALDRSVIDGLIGGRYTEAVQGDLDDNWDYAEALLSTVAASLDAGPSGGMRVTPWEIAATWAIFGEGDLIYQRARLSLPQRSAIVNTVEITFDYRYARLRQRYTTVGWSGDQISMAPCGYQYPTQQDILGAAGGSGWTVTQGIFYPAPASIPHSSGGVIYPADDAIDMAILHLTQRHSQTVSESYALTVSAPESVALNGELPHAVRGALQSSFDGGAWESALDVAPLMPTGGEQDYAPDTPRTDADYAINTLLDQARAKILSTHRGARVGNAVLCNPDLDLDKKVEIDTAGVAAAGKVASVAHVLDFAAGSAVSEFEIAIFGAGGVGIITPDTLAPPDPPPAAVETHDWLALTPSLSVNTFGGTPYSDGLMGLLLNPPESIYVQNVPPDNAAASFPNPHYAAGSYPVTGFRVQMPGVNDADRNPLDKSISASYSMIIPSDPLSLTVP